MFDITTEVFLNTYFLFEAMAGRLTGSSTFLFDRLYDVFLLPQSGRLELFELTQSEQVREITTYADYAQVCRIQKYAALAHLDDALSDKTRKIVSVKGNALRKAKQYGFEKSDGLTETAICKLISDSANIGFVTPLCVLGFLQNEGIFVAKNFISGRKILEKAAQWNSIEGILLLLYYDKDGRQKNLDRLYTSTRGTLYEELNDRAHRVYGIRDARILAENKLLQKAVGAGILKSELYASQYARFLFSDALSIKDKERALFSGRKEAMFELADLPLKLEFGEVHFDPAPLAALPVSRDAERERILKCVYNSDLRKDSSYRPMCISSDSEYLLGLYSQALAESFPDAHIETIDVADLNDYDLDPTKNNVFIRSCDEDGQNVFFLHVKGEIRETVAAPVKSFLQGDKRGKFRLQHPAAVIDLSAILPICFCDRKSAAMLKPYCDVIELAPVNASEKRMLVAHMLTTKARDYGMTAVGADGDATEMLVAYSADKADCLIDRAVRFNRNRNSGAITVTAAMLKDILSADHGNKHKYGFGGADNENK